MKRRLKYLLASFIILASFVGSFMHPAPAAADGEDYIVYYKSQLAAQNWQLTFPVSAIYARGGVFGNNNLVTFSPVVSGGNNYTGNSAAGQDATTIVNRWPSDPGVNKGYYFGNYQCRGWTITLLIGLADPINPNQFGSSQQTVGTYIWVLGGLKSRTGPPVPSSGVNGATVAHSVPSCMPGNYNTAYPASSLNHPKKTQLPLYYSMPYAKEQDWYNFLTSHGQNVDIPQGGLGSGPQPTQGGGVQGGGGGNNQLTCAFSSNPLSWVICPVVDALVTAINWVDGLITQTLTVPTNNIFCSGAQLNDTCAAYYTAWQSFRDLALGLIVIAGLVIIISQALGIELLDAYTVRRTLPRLLIAVVAITLSWPLMKFLVVLSNDLGFGIRDLILAPFSRLAPEIDFNFGGNFSNLFFGGATLAAGAVIAVPVWIVFGGAVALLAYAGTAALAVLVAILVLVLRQVVIILLMLLAPIAIVAYVLPNTQRVYKLWWESFSKALLMFPLIVAFISVGRVFAGIAMHSGGALNGLIGFIAYFGPYFAIPMTFRMAGQTMGAVGNFVQGRAQGGFQALSGLRQKSRAARYKAARTGGLYRNRFGEFTRPFAKDEYGNPKKGSLSGILNTIGNYTVDAPDTWRLKAGARGGLAGALLGRQSRSLQRRIERQRIEHSAEAAKQLQGRYHTGRAISGQLGYYYDSLDEEGRAQLRDNFGLGRRTMGEDGQMHLEEENMEGWRGSGTEKEHLQMASILERGNQGAREAAEELRADAITLDSFKGAGKEETQRADTEFMGMMIAAQAGRLENSDLAAYYNRQARAGNSEEAYLRLKQLQKLAAAKRPSQEEGYGIEYRVNPDGTREAYDVYEDPTSNAAQASIGRTPAAAVGNAKAEDLRDPEGDLSGWAQSWVAASSDYEMETVQLDRIDPRTGRHKTAVRPRMQRVPMLQPDGSGRPVVDDYGNVQTREVPVRKNEEELRRAQAARAKIQSIEGYAQGDVGVGGQIYRIMHEANIPFRFGPPQQQIDPTRQHDELPPDLQPPQPPPAEGGEPPNPFAPGG